MTPKENITISLSSDLLELLDDYCERKDLMRSQAVVRAIKCFLALDTACDNSFFDHLYQRLQERSKCKKIKNNNTLLSHNPSFLIDDGESKGFPVVWEIIEKLTNEITMLRKEIASIKQYFHIDEKPPKIIDIKVMARREAEKYRRGK